MMRKLLALVGIGVALAGCAGPHGERPALSNAEVRTGSSDYGFTGGYLGATGGAGFNGR